MFKVFTNTSGTGGDIGTITLITDRPSVYSESLINYPFNLSLT